jgi:hypothetical protein
MLGAYNTYASAWRSSQDDFVGHADMTYKEKTTVCCQLHTSSIGLTLDLGTRYWRRGMKGLIEALH